jgi:hypothetical protein
MKPSRGYMPSGKGGFFLKIPYWLLKSQGDKYTCVLLACA